eukprot:9497896-Pyramimonas_sp.AAC.1
MQRRRPCRLPRERGAAKCHNDSDCRPAAENCIGPSPPLTHIWGRSPALQTHRRCGNWRRLQNSTQWRPLWDQPSPPHSPTPHSN